MVFSVHLKLIWLLKITKKGPSRTSCGLLSSGAAFLPGRGIRFVSWGCRSFGKKDKNIAHNSPLTLELGQSGTLLLAPMNFWQLAAQWNIFLSCVNLEHSEIHWSNNSKTVIFHRAQSVPVVLCVGPSGRLVTGAVVELVVGAGELLTTWGTMRYILSDEAKLPTWVQTWPVGHISSLTLVQGGAERCGGSRPNPRVGQRLDHHPILGGGLQVPQDDVWDLLRGRHAQVTPPSEVSHRRVVLPVADAVSEQEAVPQLRLGRLMKHKQRLSLSGSDFVVWTLWIFKALFFL